MNIELLCEAAEDGDLKQVEELLEKGAKVNERHGYVQNTPLHFAKTGEVARALLKKGAQVNARNYDEGSCTPLHFAESPDVVDVLVAFGADVNAKDKLLRTPLHWTEKSDVAKALLKHGAKVNEVDSKRRTPLHWAKNEGVVTLLLSRMADINARDCDGNTPLHRTCAHGWYDAAKALLDAGCDTITRNARGETPMDVAKDNEMHNIVELLKNHHVASDIPVEIRNMNDTSVKMFCDALKSGKRRIYEIRLMVVGHFGAGKTTFTMGLLQDNVPTNRIHSTDGIEIYIGRCIVDLETMKWIYKNETFEEIKDILKKMADVLRQIKEGDLNSKDNKGSTTKTLPEKTDNKTLAPGMDTVDGIPNGPSPQIYDTVDSSSGFDTVDSSVGFDTVDSSVGFDTVDSSVGFDTVDSGLIKISISENVEDNEDFELQNSSSLLTARTLKRHTSHTPEDLLKQTLEHAKERKEVRNCAPVQVWDFGGQAIFYTTHQTFLSPRCVYTLVIDVSRKLVDLVDDTDLNPGTMMKSKIIEFLRFWVNSIISYARGQKRGFPKIFIIGTHIDQLPQHNRKKILEELFLEIRREFMNHPASEHLVIDPRFCLNALDRDDPGYNFIKAEILRIAKSQPYWGEERPTSWLPLEEVYSSLRKNGVKIISIQDTIALNKASPVHAIPEDQLNYFLLFQHSLGNILYYDEESLRDFIILDPRWLIHALRSIITAERFCKNDVIKSRIWTSLSGEGIIYITTLLQLWRRKENEEFFKNKDHLLKVLEKLDLLAKPKLYSVEGNDIEGTFYFVPSMLKEGIVGKKINDFIPKHRTATFFIVFKRKFLPPAIFQRLVAACLTMWPLLQFRKENALFSGFVGYKLDSYHHLFLQMEDHKIIVSISHVRLYKGLCHMLCTGVRCFVTSALCRLVDTYSGNSCETDTSKNDLIFDLHVPCCHHHSCCLIKLDELMAVKPLCQHHYESGSAELQRYIWFYNEMPDSMKNRPCDKNCNGPPTEILENRVLEAELGRLARVSSPAPYMLFSALDIPEERGVAIINDHRDNIIDQKYYIFSEWYRRERYPTYKKLFSLLTDVEGNVHLYCQIYKEEYSSGFKEEELETIPSDLVLDRLCDRFCKEAFQLGIELGLDHVILEALKEKHPDPLKRNREMLRLWKREGKYRPTIGKLVTALDNVGIYSTVLESINESVEDEDDWT